MRTDGQYSIYMIQHKQESDKEWVFSSFDYFGTPEGFGASGECWQRTGVHGVYDLKQAKVGLRWIQHKHPNHKFRLVLRSTIQLTLPITTL